MRGPYCVCMPAPEAVRKELGNYSELLQTLLYNRGVETAHCSEPFLNPDYDAHIHDPFQMKNMQEAVERVLSALENNERIVIYSDYDCDGIPGAAVLHDCFKKLGFTNFINYIPHRHNEGYGLNRDAVEQFGNDGTGLLITIDCGTADDEHIARARELGMDVLICDHHEVNGHAPDAILLNPKQTNETYPFRELCGAGVVFKLVQALTHTVREKKPDAENTPSEGWEKWLLDMVGIATLSDMVSLVGENRVLATYGLIVLRKTRRQGLRKLLSDLRIKPNTLTEDDIGFMIAPRINAASRMDTPEDAFQLLVTEDETEANEVAKHLHKINDERKGHVAAIVKELKKRLGERPTGAVIVTGDVNWRPSLLGLAANTVAETYNKPAFLWGRDNGNDLKGSCRSDGNVSVVDLMQEASSTLSAYGGHAFSGGFSVPSEKIHELEPLLSKGYEKHAGENTKKETYVDALLTLDDVNWNTWKDIELLAPFGEGNPKPLFLFEDVSIVRCEHFGKQKNHLKLIFENSRGIPVTAIGFFQTTGTYEMDLSSDARINLVAHMEKSMFRNIPELRLRIVDIFSPNPEGERQ